MWKLSRPLLHFCLGIILGIITFLVTAITGNLGDVLNIFLFLAICNLDDIASNAVPMARTELSFSGSFLAFSFCCYFFFFSLPAFLETSDWLDVGGLTFVNRSMVILFSALLSRELSYIFKSHFRLGHC